MRAVFFPCTVSKVILLIFSRHARSFERSIESLCGERRKVRYDRDKRFDPFRLLCLISVPCSRLPCLLCFYVTHAATLGRMMEEIGLKMPRFDECIR